MSQAKAGLIGLALILAAGATYGEEPLSAIDWLSKSIADPASLPHAVTPPPVSFSPAHPPGAISVTTLGGVAQPTLGLVPAVRSGLPHDLWAHSNASDLARLISAQQTDTLPAIRSLLYSLLIAEFDRPQNGDPVDQLFLARVDKLLDLGALDPALALLEQIDKPTPQEFRRWFDISLLLGHENHACEVMGKTPGIAPTLPAQIFCLARLGDWNAAALTLQTGKTLGSIEPEMADLLARFLDPDLFEGQPDLPLPDRPSPLTLRLMEAIGQPLPTDNLPLAFAQADLRSNAGWKARIEAGERLSRTGAIPSNRLLGLYSERAPAASGGVWERVSDVQVIEAALNDHDTATVATLLPKAWADMKAEGLEVPFAELFGSRLAGAALEGDAGALAFRIALLSGDWSQEGTDRLAPTAEVQFLLALAQGNPGPAQSFSPLSDAVRAAFLPDTPADEATTRQLDAGKSGELLLTALQKLTTGANGDIRDVTDGLLILRKLGLDQMARRIGIELLLLKPQD